MFERYIDEILPESDPLPPNDRQGASGPALAVPPGTVI